MCIDNCHLFKREIRMSFHLPDFVQYNHEIDNNFLYGCQYLRCHFIPFATRNLNVLMYVDVMGFKLTPLHIHWIFFDIDFIHCRFLFTLLLLDRKVWLHESRIIALLIFKEFRMKNESVVYTFNK